MSGSTLDTDQNQSYLQSMSSFVRQTTNSFIPGTSGMGSQMGQSSSGIENKELYA